MQYAISSLSRPRADAAWLMTRGQDHWGIESLHWVRDVTFGEDKCQVRHGHAPQNLAAFRNAAISLLRLGGCIEKLIGRGRKLNRLVFCAITLWEQPLSPVGGK